MGKEEAVVSRPLKTGKKQDRGEEAVGGWVGCEKQEMQALTEGLGR